MDVFQNVILMFFCIGVLPVLIGFAVSYNKPYKWIWLSMDAKDQKKELKDE